MAVTFLQNLFEHLMFVTPEFDVPDEDRSLRVNKAIIHELDIVENAQNNRHYDIKFIHHQYNVTVDSNNTISDIIKSLHDGSYPWGLTGGEPALQWPYSNHLSVGNDVKELTYIIYLLSWERNWQFRHVKSPITLSNTAKAKKAYFNSTKGDKRGNEIYLPAVKADECRVAYIVANADKAFGDDREYIDRINLHVDMVSDIKGKKHYMPIIIDPDIRYPGGSSP